MNIEKHNHKIKALPVLQDNIIWVWIEGNEAVVIDPALTKPVADFLKGTGITLTAILQTHHHDDHIGGTEGLLDLWPNTQVIASKADIQRIPFQTMSIQEGDVLQIMGSLVEVLEVTGHTKTHVAYYLPPKPDAHNSKPALFCGDTLFGAGCGRIFEGTAEEMYNALQKINELPSTTRIYCAHEYTQQNLRWASSLYPEDQAVKRRLNDVNDQREKGLNSLPSLLSEERDTNLFLRAKDINEFSYLRTHKDQWKDLDS